MTQGHKFGATFLAYEGDPLTCHSKYLVHVNVNAGAEVDMQTLITCERMANTVAKDLLIAYLENEDVKYITITFNKSSKLR